jgi:hypothetical protein
MLSDEQKKLIEAEETHRHEFRKALKEASVTVSKKVDDEVSEVKAESQIMAFLNSSVGTLLLSSVVITGGAGLIQQI